MTTEVGYPIPGVPTPTTRLKHRSSRLQWIPERVFDVTDYGAKGDGVTNDRAGMQAAIDAAVAAGGGTVLWPLAGTYLCQITTPGWPGSTTLTYANAAPYMGLVVNGDNITLQFSPGVKLSFLPYGGDPDTNWQLTGEGTYRIWRGGGIWITGGASWAARRTGITILGGELDGNYTYTGNHTFPGNASTGDGWDLTHKGIWFHNDKYVDRVKILDTYVHNFAGELIYSGGADSGATPVLGRFDLTRVRAEQTNGSAISMGAALLAITDPEISVCAGAGIENAYQDGHHEVSGAKITATLLDAIAYVGYNEGIGSLAIHDCPLLIAGVSTKAGVALYSTWNAKVQSNTMLDCTGVRLAIGAGYPNDTMRDVDVFDNLILANAASPASGISLGMNAGEGIRLRVKRNKIGQTASGLAGGFIVAEPISKFPTTDLDQIDLMDNEYLGTHGDTTATKCFAKLLATTASTVCCARKISVPGAVRVSIAYRVAVAATNVTIDVRTNNDAGTLITYNVMALTSKAVGNYTVDDFLVPCGARGTTDVRVTAGTASQVYVTAVIREA